MLVTKAVFAMRAGAALFVVPGPSAGLRLPVPRLCAASPSLAAVAAGPGPPERAAPQRP